MRVRVTTLVPHDSDKKLPQALESDSGLALICWSISKPHFMYEDVLSWGRVPIHTSFRVLAPTSRI